MALIRSFNRYEPFFMGYRSGTPIKIFYGGPGFTNPTGYFKTMARWFSGTVTPLITERRFGILIFGGSTPGPDPNAEQPEPPPPP